MKNKPTPPKTIKSATKNSAIKKTMISKNAPVSSKPRVTATIGEVKAAGNKVMKKYNIAIKKLADR